MKKIFSFLTILTFTIVILANCGGTATQNSDTKEEGKKEEVGKTDNVTETPEKKDDRFVSKDGSFKIAFPGEPTFSQEDVETELGKLKLYTYEYSPSEQKSYMIAYSDYPPEVIKEVDTKKLLDNSKTGFITSLKAKIEEEKSIKLGDNDGVYFKAQGKAIFTLANIYFVKNRLYQIVILASDAYPTKDEADKFFNSFELVKK